jgi:CDP-diacylglycerol--glycerol-3-phosphate 3-phosphatidyltransferase
MESLAAVRKKAAYYLTDLPVSWLARTRVTPNALSWIGFGLTLGAAALVTLGQFIAAGFVFLAAGFMDILDGGLARRTGRVTRFGAVLDATLDRASEAALFLGILGLFLLTGPQPVLVFSLAGEWSVLLVFVSWLGSVLVSYIRARAEANGIDCQSGLFTRTERVILLTLGIWFNQLVLALAIIGIFSYITAGQRLVVVRRQTRDN